MGSLKLQISSLSLYTHKIERQQWKIPRSQLMTLFQKHTSLFCQVKQNYCKDHPRNRKPQNDISIFKILLLTIKLNKLEFCKKIAKSLLNIQQKIENLLRETEKEKKLTIHYDFFVLFTSCMTGQNLILVLFSQSASLFEKTCNDTFYN